MPNPIIHYFKCPNCGTVEGKRCVRCDAEEYIKLMNGSRPEIPEGEDDRRPDDPLPHQIQIRAVRVRAKQEFPESRDRGWRNQVRVVREYSFRTTRRGKKKNY